MKNRTMARVVKVLGGGAVMWVLAAPMALAGPEQDAAQAEKEFARGDLVASMALWNKAAKQGFAPAQARLADILDKSEEDVAAVDWYRKAAEQGNAAGEYGLGQMYAKGEGVKRDFEQAKVYILRAAEKNHADAVRMMEAAYRSGGLGLPMDKAQADAWQAKLVALAPEFKKAAPVQAAGKAKKGDAR